jgi:hypothetical protein
MYIAATGFNQSQNLVNVNFLVTLLLFGLPPSPPQFNHLQENHIDVDGLSETYTIRLVYYNTADIDWLLLEWNVLYIRVCQ